MMQNSGNRQYSPPGKAKSPLFYILLGVGATFIVMALVLGVVLALGMQYWANTAEEAPPDVALSEPVRPSPPVAQQPRRLPGVVDDIEIPRVQVQPDAAVGVGAGAVAPPPEVVEAAPPVADDQAEMDEAAREEMQERERVFMQKRFLEVKGQMLAGIDAYFMLPEEERLAYFQEFMRQMDQQARTEREKAGLPAQPQNPRRVFQDFMQMFGEYSTEEERLKAARFSNDVGQQFMRRAQRQLEERLNLPPEQP